MNLFYVLPKKNYFTQGMRGRVAHAIGLGEAFSKNGISTEVISGPGTHDYFHHCSVSEVRSTFRFFWVFSLLKKLTQITKDKRTNQKTLLIRYTSTNSWLLSFYLRNLCKNRAFVFGFEINSLAYHQTPKAPIFIRRLVLKIECKILKQADFCYVVSEQLKKDIVSKLDRPAFASKIVIVPNGGPDAKPVQRVEPGSNHIINYAFFGIYQKYYNIGVVLEAFKRFSERNKNTHLHFYGDGPQLQLINRKASENRNIFEHGRYNLNDLVDRELTSNSTILVLPFGEENENQIRSPIKLYEYMSLGLPIVASDCAQIQNVLKDRHDGLLVKNSSAESWVNAMEEIYNNHELRATIQKNVAASYSFHTWQSRATMLHDFINHHTHIG